MREILFKGKRKDNGEWVHGIPIECTTNCYDKSTRIITEYSEDELDYYCPCILDQIVIPETVCQSTGRQAYNKEGQKKTIYEKDICEVTVFDHNGSDKQYICSVEELGGGFAFVNEKENFYYNLTDFEDTESDVVIIGNIHDNPELLRSESNE